MTIAGVNCTSYNLSWSFVQLQQMMDLDPRAQSLVIGPYSSYP